MKLAIVADVSKQIAPGDLVHQDFLFSRLRGEPEVLRQDLLERQVLSMLQRSMRHIPEEIIMSRSAHPGSSPLPPIRVTASGFHRQSRSPTQSLSH